MSSTNEDEPSGLSQIIPLHLIAGSTSPYGYFMAQALLERGSDPNATDPSGLTPVHVAASWGNYETLKLLLLNGGNPWLKDDDGKTPIDLAIQEGRVDCIQLLSWWEKNANGGGPNSASRGYEHLFSPRQQQQSPCLVNCSSPTSSPVYKPKYFSSPVSESPNSQLRNGRRTPISSKSSYSPKKRSSGRRVLLYNDNREIQGGIVERKDDQNCGSPLAFVEFGNSPTPNGGEKREKPKKECPVVVEQKKKENGEDGLSFLNDAITEFSLHLDEILQLEDDKKNEALAVLETTIAEENQEIDPKRLSECNKLSDKELRLKATEQGIDVGPITLGTRFLYVRRLACLLSSPQPVGPKNKYLQELQAAIEGRLNESKCRQDEMQLRLSFDSPLGTRRWREGSLKMSFCYLLLDPSVTKNLPARASSMTESQRIQTFIDGVFYIGKGKKSRPLHHLLEAACVPDTSSKSPKVEKILNLWERGFGVISLHVFHNIMPVEAYSREAAMIEAIGLDRLCNVKRGDYYGAAANWALGRRRRFGAYLLKLAASIFLFEGETPLKKEDVLKPSNG